MESAFNRLVGLVQRRYDSMFPEASRCRTRCAPQRLSHTFGRGDPAFALVATQPSGLTALSTMDLSRIAEAYIGGALDVDGDLRRALVLRTAFADRHPIAFLLALRAALSLREGKSRRRWIAEHYDYPPEFWRSFLDERHRAYSHGILRAGRRTTADAITRKLTSRSRPWARSPETACSTSEAVGIDDAARWPARRTPSPQSDHLAQRRALHARVDCDERLPCTVLYEHSWITPGDGRTMASSISA
jgi:cyclopropane-fatty-acyl-phospholipid synthase